MSIKFENYGEYRDSPCYDCLMFNPLTGRCMTKTGQCMNMLNNLEPCALCPHFNDSTCKCERPDEGICFATVIEKFDRRR